jgi:hypothetical protein
MLSLAFMSHAFPATFNEYDIINYLFCTIHLLFNIKIMRNMQQFMHKKIYTEKRSSVFESQDS